jgi:hypothetical protein
MNHQLAEAALTFARGAVTDELRAQVGIAAPVPLDPGASPGDSSWRSWAAIPEPSTRPQGRD